MNPVLLKCIAGAGLLQQISARDEGARMRIQLRDGFFHDTVVIRSGMKVLARRTGVTSPRAVETDGPTTAHGFAAQIDVDAAPGTRLMIEVLGHRISPLFTDESAFSAAVDRIIVDLCGEGLCTPTLAA